MKKNKIRLQKFLSSCGIASRRKSEDLIKEGRIKVNGTVVDTMGFLVDEEDIVEYDGKKIRPALKKYVVMNKPPGYICSRGDDFGRKTVYELLDDPEDRRSLFSIGRLDLDSDGLLLLTNDGDFSNMISHPSNEIIKSYTVVSPCKVPDELIEKFLSGIKIDDGLYRAEKITRINASTLKIFLHEGKKREIRMVYREFDIPVKSLTRVMIGKMNLNELDIKQGEYKEFALEKIKRMIYG